MTFYAEQWWTDVWKPSFLMNRIVRETKLLSVRVLHARIPYLSICGGNFMVTAFKWELENEGVLSLILSVMATRLSWHSLKQAYKWLKLGRIKKLLDATDKKALP